MKQHVDCKTANLAKSESLSTKSETTTTTLGSTQLIVKKKPVRQNKSLKEGAINKTKIGTQPKIGFTSTCLSWLYFCAKLAIFCAAV